MGRGLDVLDVGVGFEQVLLLAKGLGHGRPDTAQTGGDDEVVVGEIARGVGGRLEDGGCFGGGVDGGGGAVNGGDFGGCEGGDVFVLYPGFVGVGFVCESKRGADQVVCRWRESIRITDVANLCKLGDNE